MTAGLYAEGGVCRCQMLRESQPGEALGMRSESSFAYLGVEKNFSIGTVGYNAVFGLKVQWRSGILDAKAVTNPTTTRTTVSLDPSRRNVKLARA